MDGTLRYVLLIQIVVKIFLGPEKARVLLRRVRNTCGEELETRANCATTSVNAKGFHWHRCLEYFSESYHTHKYHSSFE